jgi:RluA family pseudouridine synthase
MGDPHGKRSVPPDVLFESASSLVLSKPAGIPVIPGRSPEDAYSLREWTEQRYPGSRIYVVHRIDKPVSGVVLFARNPEAHRAYCMAFEHGTVDKRYLALVEGTGCQNEGEIAIPLTESVRPHYVIPAPSTRKGRIHRTTYRVLERFRSFTLLELALLTGFRHQIRVHLEAIGYPLAVDPVYGTRSSLKLSDIKGSKHYKGKQVPESPIIDRVSLHALSIEFDEYQTGEIRRIEAPLPRDLAYLLKALRRYDT